MDVFNYVDETLSGTALVNSEEEFIENQPEEKNEFEEDLPPPPPPPTQRPVAVTTVNQKNVLFQSKPIVLKVPVSKNIIVSISIEREKNENK